MQELRVGLIGAGHIATTHLDAWARARGCRVEGICDLDRAQAEARARSYRLPRVFADAGELIAGCDVVDVCTPPHTHAGMIRQTAAAGRHLLVEKPVVTRVAEWDELQPLLAASPGRLAVLHNLKYSRAVDTARRWVEAGRIGEVLRVERLFLTDPAGDRMLGGEHWSHRLPGGRWFETLPHELYLIHLFAGPLPLVHATALRTPRAPAGAPADEVLLSFAGAGRTATVHYSAGCRENRRELTLYGSEGVVRIDVLADAASLERRRDSPLRRALGPPLAAVAALGRALPDRLAYAADRLRRRTPHARLIAAFADHLAGRGPSPTPLDEIDYVVRGAESVGRAIDRAAEEPALAAG